MKRSQHLDKGLWVGPIDKLLLCKGLLRDPKMAIYLSKSIKIPSLLCKKSHKEAQHMKSWNEDCTKYKFITIQLPS